MNRSSIVAEARARGRKALTIIALVAAAAALAACSLSRPSPVKNTYLLEPAAPAPTKTPQQPAVLRIGVISVAAPYRGKAFVFRDGDLRYSADFYDEFFVAPTAMLTEATARALAGANVFQRVVPLGPVTDDGDYVLDGFVSDLYGDTRNAAAPAAVVTIAFYLSATNTLGPGVVWSREYRQRVVADGTTPAAMARAWSAALTAIYADLARDLAAAQLPPK